jgi:hypothetical protein
LVRQVSNKGTWLISREVVNSFARTAADEVVGQGLPRQTGPQGPHSAPQYHQKALLLSAALEKQSELVVNSFADPIVTCTTLQKNHCHLYCAAEKVEVGC